MTGSRVDTGAGNSIKIKSCLRFDKREWKILCSFSPAEDFNFGCCSDLGPARW